VACFMISLACTILVPEESIAESPTPQGGRDARRSVMSSTTSMWLGVRTPLTLSWLPPRSPVGKKSQAYDSLRAGACKIPIWRIWHWAYGKFDQLRSSETL